MKYWYKKCIKKFGNDIESRQLTVNIIGNYLVKGGSMLVSLLIMPAYMNYFESQEVLGMWFTLLQLLNWFMLMDFGIGGGLRNKLIAPLQNNNKKYVTELISAAYFSVSAIVIVLIILQQFWVGILDWYRILGVSPNDISQEVLTQVVHILIIGICLRFFSVLVSHILYALQKAIMPGFIMLSSNILIMFYLILARPTGNETDIVTLAYVNSIANNLPALIATVWIFATVLKGMWPRISAFQLNVAKSVLGTGGILFYLQIIIMVLFNVKELYISWFVGTKEVVDYQIYYKLVGMVGGLYTLALNPIWSAVTKALVEGHQKWIKNLYRKGMTLIGLFGLAQFLLVAFMPWIIKIWLSGSTFEVSRINGIVFCIYNIVYMWMMLNYNFACGLGRMRIISIWLTIAGIANLLLTILGSRIYGNWTIVIIATTIATIPCAAFVQKDIFDVIKFMKTVKRED